MSKTTKRLSKRVVDAIEAPPKGAQPVEVWDDAIAGFHVRVPHSGRAVYRFWYRSGATQRVVTLGRHGTVTAEGARERAKALSGAVAEHRDPAAERKAAEREAEEARRRAITVSALIDAYLQDGPTLNPAKRERSWRHDRTTLNAHVRPLIGKREAQRIHRADVEEMMSAIIKGKTARVEKLGPRAKRIVKGGPAAARAAVVATQTLFAWAEQRGLIAHNPARGVKKPPAGKRERYLSDAEVVRLFETIAAMEATGDLHGTFGDTLRLLAATGARRSEIEGLRWDEIDFQRGVVLLPQHRSKTGSKTIPLAAPALKVLAERPRTSAFVFPSPRATNKKKRKADAAPVTASGPDAAPLATEDKPANALSKNWQRVRAAAGLPNVRVHDLRHTAASLLVARGASLPMIGKILGHASPQTTQRYAHLAAEPLRALLDDTFAPLMSGPTNAGGEVVPLRVGRPKPT